MQSLVSLTYFFESSLKENEVHMAESLTMRIPKIELFSKEALISVKQRPEI